MSHYKLKGSTVDFNMTVWAGPFFYEIINNPQPVSFDQDHFTGRTVSLLSFNSRQVSGKNISQVCLHSYLFCCHQIIN